MYIKHAMYSYSPHQNSPADIFSKRPDGEVKVISILVDERYIYMKREEKNIHMILITTEKILFSFLWGYIWSNFSSDKKGKEIVGKFEVFEG